MQGPQDCLSVVCGIIHAKHGEHKMPELNEDGLIPGQPVDFETLMKIERSRKPEEQAEAAKNLQEVKPVRRGRPAKE